jgi:hypothetical protein
LRKTDYYLGGGRKANAPDAPQTSDTDTALENSSAIVFAEISVALVLALGSALTVNVIVAAMHRLT